MARSKITKVIVFTVFLLMVWLAMFYTVVLTDAAINSDLPMDSINSPRPEDSYKFQRFEHDLVDALFYKTDVSDIGDYSTMPTIYYRATYPDGSVRTNVPADDYAKQGDEFFRSRKVFALLSTTPEGFWSLTSNHDTSSRRMYRYPRAVRADITAFGTAIPTEGNSVVAQETTPDNTYNEYGWSTENPCPIVHIAYAYDDAGLAAVADYYSQSRSYILVRLVLIGAMTLAGVLCGLWLLITSGRRRGSDELHLLLIDRLPAEVQICITGGLFTCFVLLFLWCITQLEYLRMLDDRVFYLSVISGATAVSGLTLAWCLSMVRMLKARTFFRNSITFTLCRWCWQPFAKLLNMARSCFDNRAFPSESLTKSLMKRQMVFLSALATLLVSALFCSLVSYGGEMTSILIFVVIVLSVVSYWHVHGNIKTYEQINQGMSDSVADQIKSERTKTALITNVSHDLKTPLTSIITYVDLLSQEELSDTARDYVTVIAQKSERLKSMVSDLFDLAKSSSGNLPLDLETLDLHRLLEQTIADMRDSIDASGLVLKTSFPDGEVAIYSDGKKLYRVFQNIIGNALKYSLAGTRVFVSLELVSERAVAIVRNTAGYEMEFTADEVLQRFVRGDNARSGEGSGLGLSIADSFTSACGGELRLDIDGDLFKVTTSFPVVAASRLAETKTV